jgi:undecaprenyl-diphosphatase
MIRALFHRIRPPMVRALLPGLLVTAVGVGAFVAVLDQFLERDDLYFVDQPVLEGLARQRTPWLTTALTWVTNAFGPGILPMLVGVACLAWWLATKRWRNPALLAGAMVTSTLIAFAVKAIVHRPRPPASLQLIPGLETSFSFPSGHTAGAATLVLTLAYLSWSGPRGWRRLTALTLGSALIIALVGGSRLYLGYHFVTDVLAGASLGLVTLGLVVATSGWLDERSR